MDNKELLLYFFFFGLFTQNYCKMQIMNMLKTLSTKLSLQFGERTIWQERSIILIFCWRRKLLTILEMLFCEKYSKRERQILMLRIIIRKIICYSKNYTTSIVLIQHCQFMILSMLCSTKPFYCQLVPTAKIQHWLFSPHLTIGDYHCQILIFLRQRFTTTWMMKKRILLYPNGRLWKKRRLMLMKASNVCSTIICFIWGRKKMTLVLRLLA